MKLKMSIYIVIGLLFFYGITVKVSESNFACGYCHESQYERWKTSTHKLIDCSNCHINPGVTGAFQAQANGVKNLLIAITKGVDIKPHKDPLPISTKNCMGCHGAILYLNEIGYEDLPDNSLKGQSLVIAHRLHIEKYSMECVECHRGIVHDDPDKIAKYPTNWPFMHKDCGPCHNGKYQERFKTEVTDLEDKSKCTVCHPTYIPPPEYD